MDSNVVLIYISLWPVRIKNCMLMARLYFLFWEHHAHFISPLTELFGFLLHRFYLVPSTYFLKASFTNFLILINIFYLSSSQLFLNSFWIQPHPHNSPISYHFKNKIANGVWLVLSIPKHPCLFWEWGLPLKPCCESVSLSGLCVVSRWHCFSLVFQSSFWPLHSSYPSCAIFSESTGRDGL